VNDVAQEYSMKLGEGGEAFFVFETTSAVPEGLQTSPLVSPAASPQSAPVISPPASGLSEPEPLDLATDGALSGRMEIPHSLETRSTDGLVTRLKDVAHSREQSLPVNIGVSAIDDSLIMANATLSKSFDGTELPSRMQLSDTASMDPQSPTIRSASPPPVTTSEAVTRAMNLSKKLWGSNIPSQITETGDLKLDMTGYKSNEEEALRAEMIARKILSEEFEGNYDIGSLVGLDNQGNLWIYSSEEKKEAAARQVELAINVDAMRSTDAVSDPGYHSDDAQSEIGTDYAGTHLRRDSDSAIGLASPQKTPAGAAGDPNRNYAKTLRLSSEQLKAMNLKPGANPCSFSVNRAVCQASIHFWKHDVPVVISDIDGTITK
jgi:phosphatidate phosphatase LPIN